MTSIFLESSSSRNPYVKIQFQNDVQVHAGNGGTQVAEARDEQV